jgi:malto-oligosyltrehalose trehalohydrolase
MTIRFGPTWRPGEGTTFRLWGPAASSVELVVNGRAVTMPPHGDGWYEATLPGARSGARYLFRIDGRIEVPDPASHFQPDDVHGPSEVVDHAYAWTARDWRGRLWHEAVFLELHVGTFTPHGTFRSAIEQLDHVADAGFTAIELMPVADFSGRRNWGYDGVLWYAPDSAYGRPEDLKALIDAAHLRGLMVFLDVVYNHFGPDGNYLGQYAPQFFTAQHKTPWGDAIDYRVPQVRAFAVDNALHWLDRYRFDGLRLDAVHALVEPGEPSVLSELSEAVGRLAAQTGRHIHLVLENDNNRAALLDPLADPPAGRYRAQWNDDYHHAWHTLLTNESHGYYRDYKQPKPQIARSLAEGFVYQGEISEHRQNTRRGEPSGTLPATAFINFLQNHDQIGNRAHGDRLSSLADQTTLEAALTIMLLAPMPPLMFMGEEWGAAEPFPFFCDFAGELADAVRKGRRAEFAEAYADPSIDVPDPLSEATFQSAILDWSAREHGAHKRRLDLVRALLRVRREQIMPRLANLAHTDAQAQFSVDLLQARWRLGDGSMLHLVANLSARECARPGCADVGTPIWGERPSASLPPWSVYWHIGGG